MARLYLEFSSRRPGSFGDGLLGRVFEWLTSTWMRFTCLIISVPAVLVITFSDIPASEKFFLILIAPLAAIFYWYVFLLILLVSQYIGPAGIMVSRALIVYFFLFSRLVVQKPPIVGLNLTRR